MKPTHPLKRLEQIIADAEQLVRDVEWWNRNRTDAPPMDCEPERVMLPMARACLASWDPNDTGEFTRRVNELAAHGVASREREGDL